MAKTLQEKYKDVIFASARIVHDTKRKKLQVNPEKRKTSLSSLMLEELNKIGDLWNLNTPSGLQRKFYHIASYELEWRGGEAVNCLTGYFSKAGW